MPRICTSGSCVLTSNLLHPALIEPGLVLTFMGSCSVQVYKFQLELGASLVFSHPNLFLMKIICTIVLKSVCPCLNIYPALYEL